MLISTNCTTAIEAFFLNKKTINFLPYKDESVEYLLPKATSKVIRNTNDLIKIVKNYQNPELFSLDQKSYSKIKEWLFNAFDGCAVDNTIDVLNKNIKDFKSKTKDNKDKFTDKISFIFLHLIRKLRLKYNLAFGSKSYQLKYNLILQKFPSLTLNEIEQKVVFFFQIYGKRKILCQRKISRFIFYREKKLINSNIKIGNRIIGDNHKPFIIAEIGQAHEGKISKVLKYIDLISKTGVDAIKFQTHIAEEESTLDEPFRKNYNFKLKFKNRYEYWKSVEFNINEWHKIKKYAEKKKLIFLTSVFSIKAIDMMKKIGAKALKIGSGEFNSIDLINQIIETKLPILLSTGMAKLSEIDKLNKFLKKKKASYGFFQCTSNYPVKLEKVGVNLINELKRRYHCPIGLSDHSGTIYPSIFSLSLNTNLLELHVKFNKKEKNPDSTSSIDVKDLKKICEINNSIYLMRKNPVNKFVLSKDIKKMKVIFGKSISLKKDIQKGELIEKENILMKKPAIGLSYRDINKIIGKKAKRYVSSKRILKRSDIK